MCVAKERRITASRGGPDPTRPASEVFALYERNWRLVDVDRLDDAESALLERLKAEFGNGVING